jgi:hypothetical protein
MITGATSFSQGLGKIFAGIATIILTPITAALRTVLTMFQTIAEKLKVTSVSGMLDSAIKALDVADLLGTKRPRKFAVVQASKRRADARKAQRHANDSKVVSLQGKTEIKVEAKPGDVKIALDNKTYIDSKQVGKSAKKAKVEYMERLGNVQNPFFDRALYSGSSSAMTGGGR